MGEDRDHDDDVTTGERKDREMFPADPDSPDLPDLPRQRDRRAQYLVRRTHSERR